MLRISICAVGRLRAGPEKTLLEDYVSRIGRTGKPVGLGPAAIREVEDRKGGGMEAEAALLRAAIPDGAFRIALDERGKVLSSGEFANFLARLRDDGRRDAAFLIGGADGLAPQLRDDADYVLSLGPMVWPHMLVCVMLAEQLYRAASILAGSPYHRA